MTELFQEIAAEKKPRKIADQILAFIADGQLKVGERMPSERRLSEMMGVSRASIREALSYLEMSGFIKTVRGSRTLVSSVADSRVGDPLQIMLRDDHRKVVELAEIRAFMEAWAAREAARKRSVEQLELMAGYLGEMETDFARGVIDFEKDLAFHLTIAAAANNTIFSHLINTIYDLVSFSVKVHREDLYTSRREQELILQHHRNLYETIAAGDPVHAELAMQEHLGFVIREFKKKFK
ncbi:MAG: FadR family transcriptional regulator [Deltaproteobacteria bacterium]|nr:FadR family transcriptional regulator [Candidatus Anaeroferrophillacea bacterium]